MVDSINSEKLKNTIVRTFHDSTMCGGDHMRDLLVERIQHHRRRSTYRRGYEWCSG